MNHGPMDHGPMDHRPMDHEDPETAEIIEGLRNMPKLEPPPVLLTTIMTGVRNTRRPWWYRFTRWATAPRHFTFTVFKVAPLAAALLLVGVFSGVHLFRKDTVQIHVASNGFPGKIPVTLSLDMENAASVAVVGSFNAWSGEGHQMQRSADGGQWTLTMLLPQGRYEYAFMVDGKQMVADPRAMLLQDDGFGNQNAVLIVGDHHGHAI